MADVKLSLKFSGLDEFVKKLERRPAAVAPAILSALFMEGEELMAEAKNLTPVDTGALRSSGHVQPPVVTDDGASVELGFGGVAGSGSGQEKDVGYAVFVHEDLEAHHPVGQAKYLEQPLNARRDTFAERFAGRVRAVMSRV